MAEVRDITQRDDCGVEPEMRAWDGPYFCAR